MKADMKQVELQLLQAIYKAAKATYINDDVFARPVTEKDWEEIRKRDKALGNAIEAYEESL